MIDKGLNGLTLVKIPDAKVGVLFMQLLFVCDLGLNGLTLVKIPDASEVDEKYVLLVSNLSLSSLPN